MTIKNNPDSHNGTRTMAMVVAITMSMLTMATPVQVDVNAFRHRCVVTFSGYSGAETLQNFPALVRIPVNAPIYSASKPDGSDIRFADSNGNLVPHEIDTWNPSGESLIWVKVPMLSGTGTTVTLYCGGAPLPTVNPREVWGAAGYKGVWHFSGSNADSSTNALAGTDSATAPTYNTAGRIGTAFHASGSSDFYVANDSKWCGYDGNYLTVSAWVKTETLDNYGRVISCRGTSNSSPGFELQMQGNSTRFNAIAADGSGTVTQNAQYITPLNANTDYIYLTAVYTNGAIQMYANGVAIGSLKSGVSVGTANQVLKIGGNATTSGNNWNGSIDEVRLQWAAQSADWVKADFDTQNNSDFAVLGVFEDNESLKVNWKEFRYRCTVTFSGFAGASELENFPALVRIPGVIASRCKNNGSDIRFVDSEGFIVPHEVDTWNPSGTSLIWVSVPRLSGTDTTLTMYYRGKPSQSVQPRNVWAVAGYRGVWHFSGSNADSSPNALTATDTAIAPVYDVSGKVGTAFSTAGSSYLEVANDDRWAAYDGNSLTVSAWVKTAVATGYGRVISCKNHASNESPGFELSMQNEAKRFNAIAGNGTARSQNAQYITPLSADTEFVYLTTVYQNGSILLYANGSFVGRKDDSVSVGKSQTVLRIGGCATTTANNWNGILDEVRLQWSTQGVDWVAADYATQSTPNFAVLGQPEPLRGINISFR